MLCVSVVGKDVDFTTEVLENPELVVLGPAVDGCHAFEDLLLFFGLPDHRFLDADFGCKVTSNEAF